MIIAKIVINKPIIADKTIRLNKKSVIGKSIISPHQLIY